MLGRGRSSCQPGADPHGPGGSLLSRSSVAGLRGGLNQSNHQEAMARNQLLFSGEVSLKRSQLLTNTNQIRERKCCCGFGCSGSFLVWELQ